MKDLLTRCYLLYGKYYQEIGLVKTPQQTQYLMASKKMYDKVNEITGDTKNNHIKNLNNNAQRALSLFCETNGIEI